jgi:hypothetical protein
METPQFVCLFDYEPPTVPTTSLSGIGTSLSGAFRITLQQGQERRADRGPHRRRRRNIPHPHLDPPSARPHRRSQHLRPQQISHRSRSPRRRVHRLTHPPHRPQAQRRHPATRATGWVETRPPPGGDLGKRATNGHHGPSASRSSPPTGDSPLRPAVHRDAKLAPISTLKVCNCCFRPSYDIFRKTRIYLTCEIDDTAAVE